jgi:cyclopropane fatty-acyl-phospholipid synthase-like methyltransferase
MSTPRNHDTILAKVDRYYTSRLAEHGATPRGVDWNSVEAQEVRFEQLAKLLNTTAAAEIIDYGCGYGAFADYILGRRSDCTVIGFDVSSAMVAEASRRHEYDPRCRFTDDPAALAPADVVLASGIFSVKMDVANDAWEHYIETTIQSMAALSKRGFAFNMLTAYSDPERMRGDLYYADPLRFFTYCRTHFSRNVALLHDYELYEFTLHVCL